MSRVENRKENHIGRGGAKITVEEQCVRLVLPQRNNHFYVFLPAIRRQKNRVSVSFTPGANLVVRTIARRCLVVVSNSMSRVFNGAERDRNSPREILIDEDREQLTDGYFCVKALRLRRSKTIAE